MESDGANAVISAKDVAAAVEASDAAFGPSPQLPGVRKSLKKKPKKPTFPALSAHAASGGKAQFRQVPVPRASHVPAARPVDEDFRAHCEAAQTADSYEHEEALRRAQNMQEDH